MAFHEQVEAGGHTEALSEAFKERKWEEDGKEQERECECEEAPDSKEGKEEDGDVPAWLRGSKGV